MQIQKWHEHLQPILAKSRERHHFDVFHIGTEIINDIQKSTKPIKSITFENVMNSKDPAYVSRYFLSSLLLVSFYYFEVLYNLVFNQFICLHTGQSKQYTYHS